MIGASPQFGLREAQKQALDELERLNGSEIGGLRIHIDMELLRKFYEESKPPCDCLDCYIRKNFY